MRTLLPLLLTLGLFACRSLPEENGLLVHHVTLTLADESEAEVAALLEACWKLTDVPGVLALEAGLPAKELADEEQRQDYSVALRVVFPDRAAHDAYQTHPLHLALLETFGPKLAGAEVRDWWIAGAPVP